MATECPGVDGLVCLNGWLYSSVGMMIFPKNEKCPECNDVRRQEEFRMAEKRCSEEGCDKFALLGKDHCYDHVPGKEDEPEEVEIPQRFLDRDPNPENWLRYHQPVGDQDGKLVLKSAYLECPFCACMVHEDSAMWHARYHISLNNNISAIYRVLQNRG